MNNTCFRLLFAQISFCGLCYMSCQQLRTKSNPALPSENAFTDTINGRPASFYVLKSSTSAKAAICTYGARLVRLLVPLGDKTVLSLIDGRDSLVQYCKPRDAELGLLATGYGARHWNAVQLNDSTLELQCSPIRLTCMLNGLSLQVSGNYPADSLLAAKGIILQPDAPFDIKRIQRQGHDHATVIYEFILQR